MFTSTVSRVLLLGAGASSATPMIRCLSSEEGPCPVCLDSIQNPLSKNRRSNPSLLVEYTTTVESSGGKRTKNLLIDMGKTFREAYLKHLKENVLATTAQLSSSSYSKSSRKWSPEISSVVLTHFHADAILGLDDVRELIPRGADALPLYCDAVTIQHVKKIFPYLFPKDPDPHQHPKPMRRWVGALQGNIIEPYSTFSVDSSLHIDPIPLDHGDCTAYGFLLPLPNGKRLAYLSDLGSITEEQIQKIKQDYGDIEVLFIDCIVTEEVKFQNPAHLGGQRTFDAALSIGAKRTFLVGMNHTVDYYAFKEKLANEFPGACMEPGWDGMELNFDDTGIPPTSKL